MTITKPGWGAVVQGEPADLEEWTFTLKEPFDPWIEIHGTESVLRSASFDELASAEEVRDRAVTLIERLNGAVALSEHANQLHFGSIIRFAPDGTLHRTIQPEPGAYELSGRGKLRVDTIVIGPDGRPVPSSPPQPSEVQKWFALAENDGLLDDALIYFGRATNWFDAYKTLETLILRFGGGEREFLALGWASENEITRLKHTANAAARHAKRKFEPPRNPMTLKEARALLERLLRCGMNEAETKLP